MLRILTPTNGVFFKNIRLRSPGSDFGFYRDAGCSGDKIPNDDDDDEDDDDDDINNYTQFIDFVSWTE